MAIATASNLDTIQTLGELLDHLGGVDPARVLVRPSPGTATEADLIERNSAGQGIFELVDGVLVRKPMGLMESFLAARIIAILGGFVSARNLGIVTAPDGTVRLAPGMMRAPDVAFIPWGNIPGGRISRGTLSDSVPDLAIEVLSPGNTKAEMARKRRDYFSAGVRLVWEIDLDSREAVSYESLEQGTRLDSAGVLEGGDVLPGFALPLAELFAELDRRA